MRNTDLKHNYHKIWAVPLLLKWRRNYKTSPREEKRGLITRAPKFSAVRKKIHGVHNLVEQKSE